MFDDPNIYNNLSPVNSPAHSQDMSANRYSRHNSRRNSANEEPALEGRTIPVPGGDYGLKTHSSGSSLVLTNRRESTGQGGVGPGQDSSNSGQGSGIPGHSEAEILDEVVLSSVNETQRESAVPQIRVSVGSNGHSEISDQAQGDKVERENVTVSAEEDRLLEFEGESESEPHTSSSVSLDEYGEDGSTSASPGLAAIQHTTSKAVDISQSHESAHLSASGLEGGRGTLSSSVPVQAPLGEEGEGRGGTSMVGGERRKSEELRRGGSVVEERRRKSEGVRQESVRFRAFIKCTSLHELSHVHVYSTLDMRYTCMCTVYIRR